MLFESDSVVLVHNVLALGAVADFVAKSCQVTTKANARHNITLTTKPPLSQTHVIASSGLISKNLILKQIQWRNLKT